VSSLKNENPDTYITEESENTVNNFNEEYIEFE